MKELAVVGGVACAILSITGLYFVGRPYFFRRNLRIAEEEVAILMKSKEQNAQSKSRETTDT